jgi:hypothetical protein
MPSLDETVNVGARCDRCHGPGERRATSRSFEHRGRTVRYIGYGASCRVCGHIWDDASHSQHNARERARVLSSVGEDGVGLDGE